MSARVPGAVVGKAIRESDPGIAAAVATAS